MKAEKQQKPRPFCFRTIDQNISIQDCPYLRDNRFCDYFIGPGFPGICTMLSMTTDLTRQKQK